MSLKDNSPVFYSAGVGRTGTTYLQQILNYLWQTSYLDYNGFKGGHHSFIHPSPDAYGLVSTRDIRDIIISRWRIILSIEGRYKECLYRQMTKDEVHRELGQSYHWSAGTLVNQVHDVNLSFDQAYNPSDPKIFFVKFEDFTNDIETLFSFLLKQFNIEITEEHKNHIKTNFSKKENKKRSLDHESFSFHGDHGIHGHHIFKGESKKWNKYIPKNLHEDIIETFGPTLTKWNYKH